jgi:glycosyltransferase involved in cell wall biosynthesis
MNAMVEGTSEPKRLLVMMPALNEAATIAGVIERIPRRLPGISQIDVVVLDDGSTDDTAELARKAGAFVISHRVNRGVGAALQTCLAEAIRRQVDIAVNMDADGQFDPAGIAQLIVPVLSGKADMATASRFKDESLRPNMPVAKRFGNWGMAKLVSYLSRGSYADVSCGFRAYSREAMLRLVLTGAFTYTQESFLVLAAKGLRIVEVPLAVRGVREFGKSRVASNLLDYAWRASSIIFFNVTDYRPAAIFGTGAAGLFVLSALSGAFFVWHRIVSGQFTPHIWAGFVSAFLFGLSVLIFAIGQIALMISRLRSVQEEQLYILRRIEGPLHERRDLAPLGSTEALARHAPLGFDGSVSEPAPPSPARADPAVGSAYRQAARATRSRA